MAKRSENITIRTILPLGLGIAMGIAIGAVALASAPSNNDQNSATVANNSNPQIVNPLSSAPGVRFVRANHDGARCFAARTAQASEMTCSH